MLGLLAGCATPEPGSTAADRESPPQPSTAQQASAPAPSLSSANSQHTPHADPNSNSHLSPAASVERARFAATAVPAGMQACRGCHREVVDTYLADHAMAASLGAVDETRSPPVGTVARPQGDRHYELTDDAMILAHGADGGLRQQRIVGWIGGGVFDVSWASEEVDVLSGEPTGRLFFAPVETLRQHGNQLAPFDLSADGVGFDLALTEGCLTCHTLTPLAGLPSASIPLGGTAEGVADHVYADRVYADRVYADRVYADRVYPANGLGSDAFESLQSLGCEACHGDSAEHLRRVISIDEDFGDDLGMASLSALPAAQQRDICARCHLQGDARIDLVNGVAERSQPLAGQIPVLVPRHQGDDFRFVSQLERLAESACFAASPNMTCSTCHDPHSGVAAQGLASFEAACVACHTTSRGCSRNPGLTVEDASGRRSRNLAGAQSCVDCHVRRSQPFDLPHVASVDHWIRRRIPEPEDDVPHRQFADRQGELELYDDGRLAPVFATTAGARWKAGAEAIGLLTLGRLDEAVAGFDRFPPPGSLAARTPSAPSPLVPLETEVVFHQSRGLALMSQGRFEEALAAFEDALSLDGKQAGVLLTRAQLRFDLGQVGPALQDTQAVIDLYPNAEQPWDLRARMAERLGRIDLAQAAFEASEVRWPSNAAQLFKLGLLLRQVNRMDEAEAALQKAYVLDPDLELGGAGSIVDHLGQK